VNPPDGIVAGPVSEDNFFEWECLIVGPEGESSPCHTAHSSGTCFENGVLPARLTFPTDYPLSPPKMVGGQEIRHSGARCRCSRAT